ncbi:MAG: Lrp/AsnC ligand binding domain-containing protein [Candidatus Hodarchaeota archaeon]
MTTGYILVNTQIGFEEEVLNELLNVKGVIEGYLVDGEYDIICKINNPISSAMEDSLQKIRNLNHIFSTTTLIIVPVAPSSSKIKNLTIKVKNRILFREF